MDNIIEEGSKDKPESEPVRRKKFFSSWKGYMIKYTIIWFVILIIFFRSIFIYTGNWPSMIVVESNSMQRSEDEAFLGTIDMGDMVLVKDIENKDDVISYMKGKRIGHETYGEYGDVIIYRKNGYTDTTPVIHRAIVWLEYNETSNSYDIPELKHHEKGDERDWYVVGEDDRWYNLAQTVVLRDIGNDHEDVNIKLGGILSSFALSGVKPHSGFITLGDNNLGIIDQGALPDGHGGRVRPVVPEWVIGKARGELPGLGLIKIQNSDPESLEMAPSNSWSMFFLSAVLLFVIFFGIPICLFIIEILLKKRRAKIEKEGKEEDMPLSQESIEEGNNKPPSHD
ncbi:MAG: S26 family signal peptidase [Thermoplasmata archaeon]|nr:MAG: S26 family signal peptidase [Thermoplasmata archaeon]